MATYRVTGANRGIGLASCQQLRARGDTVIGLPTGVLRRSLGIWSKPVSN